MAYDLVIFDCDGVLVDSEPLSNRILAERLTAIGLPTTTEDAVRDYMGRSWKTDQEIIEGRLGRPLPDGWVDAYHAEVIDGVRGASSRPWPASPPRSTRSRCRGASPRRARTRGSGRRWRPPA